MNAPSRGDTPASTPTGASPPSGGAAHPRTGGEEDILATSAAGPAAVRGGSFRTLGYLLNAVVSAVAAAFLFRHLGVASTGLYVTALSITSIVGGLSDLGLSTLGVRELSVRDGGAGQRLMRQLIGLRIVVTVVGVAAAVAFSLAVGYRGLLVAGVAVAGAGLLLQSLQGTLSIWLMSRLRLGWVTVTEVGKQVVLAVLIVIGVALGAGVLTFLALQIPAAALALLLTAVIVRGRVPLKPSFAWHEVRTLLRDLLPYTLAASLAVIYFRVSVIAVSLTASAQQLGYFGTSFRILEVLTAVPSLMVTAALPIFARSAVDDHERLAYATSRVFQVGLIIGLWVAIALAVGADFAIQVIGGPKFAPAADVLRIQAFALGGGFVGAVWSMVLLSLGRMRVLIWLNFGALIAGSVLVSVLSALEGARGAAAATVCTEIGVAIVGALLLARAAPHLMPSLRPVARISVAAIAAGSLALVPGVSSWLLVLAASAVYFGVLFAVRGVPEEVLMELRRGWTRVVRGGVDG